MASFNSNITRRGRNRLMASVAALTLVVSGAVGGAILSPVAPARAAAVVTSDLQAQAMPSFSPLVARIKPAVVAIRVNVVNVAAEPGDQSGQLNNLPPEIQQFFKRFGEQNGGAAPRQAPQRGIALGSGFFISADGYVVTNNHVVGSARTVTVTTDDGRTLDASVVGTDQKTDLALLKVTERGDYPFVSLAKEAPKVGDWVVAIGNPFGLGGTVTAGIVSADGRDIGSGPYDNYLQIDAPINKGNSGGPTFNLRGEVVGVNTAIFSPSGGSVGLAFAIPASTVGTVINSLEHGGVVSRGYLGVQVQPVSQDIADGLGLRDARGALVDRAEPGTAAAGAGLKSGDVITGLNGRLIKDARELTREIGALKPGDKIRLTFLRDGREQTADLALGTQGPEQVARTDVQQDNGAPVLGLQLAPANQVPGAGDQGVVVVGVDPNGAGASKGISDGDVILEVSGKTVARPADVTADIAAAKQDGKKAVLLKIKTVGGTHFVAVVFPRA